MSTSIAHVNIVVKDLGAARDFFVQSLGFTAADPVTLTGAWVEELTGYAKAKAVYIGLSAPAGDCQIELLTYETPASPPPSNDLSQLDQIGYRHIGLNVDDIDSLYKQLSPNWSFLSEPVCATGMGVKTVYFVGPEGVIIQLTQKVTAKECPPETCS